MTCPENTTFEFPIIFVLELTLQRHMEEGSETESTGLEDSEDFDEHNQKLLNEDLDNLTETLSEEEESTEPSEEDVQQEYQATVDEKSSQQPKRTRKKSSFDPEKNKRTVFLGNLSLSTTNKVLLLCYLSNSFSSGYQTYYSRQFTC